MRLTSTLTLKAVTVVHIDEDGSHPSYMDITTSEDELRILETDIDDASPETLGPLHERLREVGARHVSVLPTTTKGARPGHLIRAIVPRSATGDVARTLAKETGTLGVRTIPAEHAFVAETDRRLVVLEVNEADHEIPVKVAWMDDEVYDVSADQTTAATIADAGDLTQRTVAARAEAIVREGSPDHLVHVVPREHWETRDATGPYEPPGLDTDGFIHCTSEERMAAVIGDAFDAGTELRALIIDPRLVSSPIRYEPGTDAHYPHVYGSLESEAIVAVRDV